MLGSKSEFVAVGVVLAQASGLSHGSLNTIARSMHASCEWYGMDVQGIWKVIDKDVGVVVFNYMREHNGSIVMFVLLVRKWTQKMCSESMHTWNAICWHSNN